MTPPVAGPRTIVACPHCGTRNRVPAVAEGVPRCGSCHQSLPWIVEAGDDDFAAVAERGTVPVLVDFWATWCGPCRMISPALEQLATERAGAVKLVKVDVDRAPELSRRFDIRAVPTLVLLRGDPARVVAHRAGAAPVPELRRWLDGALAEPTSTAGDPS